VAVETRRLVGGALCLDFTNSVDWASDGTQRGSHADVLTAPGDLASWARRAGLAGASSATAPELDRAHALRSSLHDAFAAIAAGTEPTPTALRAIAGHYAEAVEAARLTGSGRSWDLAWRLGDPRRVRFAIAASAVDLLRDDARLERLRMCPGHSCGWLFLDSTGRRRWCSMEVCGSRAKMRRLYARRRAAAAP
jgi:predicted RNA-binding Zn ribbon-like protein